MMLVASRSIAKLAKWILILVVFGALLIYGSRFVPDSVFKTLGISNPFATETIDRSQPALLLSVQELSQYHAAVGNFEVIIDEEKNVPWVPSFIAGERSLFIAGGTVSAYVDFSGLGDGDLELSEDGQTVEIRIPKAQLDRPNLDHDRTYLFSQKRGYINRYQDAITSADQRELYEKATEKLEKAAKQSELRSQADTNARSMLTGMFGALNLKVKFVEPAK